jgi:transcriptional regulator GlxA family with amidase domain
LRQLDHRRNLALQLDLEAAARLARPDAHPLDQPARDLQRLIARRGIGQRLVQGRDLLLVLYLIARHVGATAAQTVARFFALQWHHDGLAPYIVFQGRKDHGDTVVTDAQGWLSTHFSVVSPVDQLVRRSGLAERTFKRRFTEATGFAPIEYVQRLRIEDAKRRLERTDASADEISWQVGYEDAAFFRRLFKRFTGLTPGAYRRRFQVPAFARSRSK